MYLWCAVTLSRTELGRLPLVLRNLYIYLPTIEHAMSKVMRTAATTPIDIASTLLVVRSVTAATTITVSRLFRIIHADKTKFMHDSYPAN